MKLSAFIANAFGIVGFVLSVAAGLLVDNPFETILLKAIGWTVVCYLVGYLVGAIAQQVSLEHAQSLAKRVADADTARAAEEAEERARRETELETPNSGETAVAIPAVPGKT